MAKGTLLGIGIGLSVFAWLMMGFLGFLLFVSLTQMYDRFDSTAKKGLGLCLLFGPITLCIVAYIFLSEKFTNFMENYIQKANKK